MGTTAAAAGSGSGSGGGAAPSASLAAAGTYTSRRYNTWVGANDAAPDGADMPLGAAAAAAGAGAGHGNGNGVGGTARGPMDYRSAILSPPSGSPGAHRANAPGSASPRSTPLHRSVNLGDARGGAGGGGGGIRTPGVRNSLGSWATGGSPGSAHRPSRMSMYEGGENREPGPSPGSGSLASGGKTVGGGAGKSPVVELYQQKARESQARNKALREALARNFEQPGQKQAPIWR
jgi:hypothetical protein